MSFPYQLPAVYASYSETFAAEPAKTMARLEGLLKRRGNDAVGYLLLAWMHRSCGNHPEALQKARMAAVFAPGSGRIEAAPYLFSHPDFFEALLASHAPAEGRITGLDLTLIALDSLIDELTKPSTSRISLKAEYDNHLDLSERTLEDADDIASETLAIILTNQEKWTEALAMYERLDAGTGTFSGRIAELKNRLIQP